MCDPINVARFAQVRGAIPAAWVQELLGCCKDGGTSGSGPPRHDRAAESLQLAAANPVGVEDRLILHARATLTQKGVSSTGLGLVLLVCISWRVPMPVSDGARICFCFSLWTRTIRLHSSLR